MKKYDEYARIADVNEHKDINDIVVGDFVWGCTGIGKDCGICNLLHSPGQPRLLKVVRNQTPSNIFGAIYDYVIK